MISRSCRAGFIQRPIGSRLTYAMKVRRVAETFASVGSVVV